ncbi:uncharacterized protein PV07_02847 [Cladophialophora immunda]|uniref:Transcription factor domain-containing protein n=1 Tax=Cladophialophora immunda TaxID=569365 RepID=A0A0D2D652_9EURO|nr:uncharacterized protein PV07_02847 [Cladophialophora immunda]KIW31179.1 hypothetical protein PV07_02847 [Cladophialophora immunda]
MRQQSYERAPKPDACDTQQEVPQRLSAETDSNSYATLRSLYTSWLPHLHPDENPDLSTQDLDFDAGLGDPLTLCVKLTAFFSRAAFFSSSSRRSTIANNEPFPIQRALYLYKLSAIQMIRSRLSENPQSPDQNIFLGIVTLAGCEFMANNPEEGRLHLEACLEIAHARGGLCTLSSLELELVCLAEFDIAALLGKAPCAPLQEMEAAVYSNISKERIVPAWAESDLAKLDCLCTEEASQTRQGLACLLQSTHGLNGSKSSKSRARSQDNLVLRGLFAGFLLCSNQPYTTPLYLTEDIGLYEPLRVAGMLVVAATCLKNTPKDHLLDRLTTDLALQLQLMPLPFYGPRPVASAMLWIYFVGAHGSPAPQKRLFFQQGVAHVARLMGLETWEEVREQLRRFPYVDGEFDGPCEEIWNSAMILSSLTARP